MRSSDAARRAGRRRGQHLALLVVVASLLGMGGPEPARAQDGAPATTGEDLFGAYQLDAHGVGVRGRYELEGILPGGSPVLDLGLPETLARFSSGPTGYGLAGLAYPGPLLANMGTLAAQGGFGEEDSVPPWPIKAEAFYPSGPVEADTSQGPAVQKVITGDLGVQVDASFPSIDAPPVVSIGSVAAATRTAIEGRAAISRTRVVLDDVKVLGGVLTIDSVVTDLVAAHDGTAGSTNGGTTASGVRFLGLAAHLDEDGLVLDEAPASDGPAAPLGGLLGPLHGPLADATNPVRAALQDVLRQAVPQLDDLLARAGITVKILDPHEEQVETGAANRTSSGLMVEMRFEGKEQPALVDLVNSIPAELKPSLGPIPNPVTFLAENHITALSLAPGSVSALATPPFPALDGPVADLPGDAGALGPSGSGGLRDPGFSTAPAPLPVPASDGGGSVEPPTEPVSSTWAGAVPAVLVALALLAAPLFGLGSTRLADNVLAPTGASCPLGLDALPQPPRPS